MILFSGTLVELDIRALHALHRNPILVEGASSEVARL